MNVVLGVYRNLEEDGIEEIRVLPLWFIALATALWRQRQGYL